VASGTDARWYAIEISKMQEPEIFEQPVATKDTEATAGAVDDNHTYHTGYGSGYQTNNTAEDSSLDDYHDFVYPEGGSNFV
jgi:hypothetical protein